MAWLHMDAESTNLLENQSKVHSMYFLSAQKNYAKKLFFVLPKTYFIGMFRYLLFI